MDNVINFFHHLSIEISNSIIGLLPNSIARVFWQIGFIVLSIILAYFLSKKVNNYIKKYFLDESTELQSQEHDTTSFNHQLKLFINEIILRSSFALFGILFLLLSQSVLHVIGQGTKLVKIITPLLISLIVIRLFVYLLRQSIGRHNALFTAFEKVISVSVWGISALYITGTLNKFVSILDDFNLSIGKSDFSLLSLFQAIFVIAFVALMTLWISRIIESQITNNKHIDLNLRVMLNKLSKALIFVIATMIALPLAGIDLTVLSVFGGALGVGLGFGLQKIASNYISGFIILMDKSIKIGDMVTVDNHYGQVTQLNARYIVIRDLSNVEYIIPNEILISSTVTNHSYSDNNARVSVLFSVAYGSDIEQVQTLVLNIAHKFPRILKNPEPQVFIKTLNQGSIDFELSIWIPDLDQGYMVLKSKIFEQILIEFKQHNIEIPFPQQDIHIKTNINQS